MKPDTSDPFDASWRERVLVMGAVLFIVLSALVYGLLYQPSKTLELIGIIPASVFLVGKFLPMWGASGESNFSPWQLGLVIWILDTFTVLVIVYGLEAFYRFKRLKQKLETIQSNAQLVLRAYPKMKRGAIVAVILFVLFPLAGTGAMVGSFLGILLGLHRYVLIGAVSLGGLLGGMAMAYAATHFGSAVVALRTAQQNLPVKVAIITAVACVIAAIFIWGNRLYKRALQDAATDSGHSR